MVMVFTQLTLEFLFWILFFEFILIIIILVKVFKKKAPAPDDNITIIDVDESTIDQIIEYLKVNKANIVDIIYDPTKKKFDITLDIDFKNTF